MHIGKIPSVYYVHRSSPLALATPFFLPPPSRRLDTRIVDSCGGGVGVVRCPQTRSARQEGEERKEADTQITGAAAAAAPAEEEGRKEGRKEAPILHTHA